MRRGRGRRRLWAAGGLVAGLALIVAATEYLDDRAEPPDTEGPAAAPPLLAVAVEELDAVEVIDHGRLHRFERDAAGSWFYHAAEGAGDRPHSHAPGGRPHTHARGGHAHPPGAGAADPALGERIAGVLAALGRARVERQFPLDAGPAAYGLAAPDVVLIAYRRGRPEPAAQYAVGHVAPDTVSQYVMTVGSPMAGTVPKYQIDNLLALVAEAGGASAPGTARRR